MPKKNPKHQAQQRDLAKTNTPTDKGKGKITPKEIGCNVVGCKNPSIHSLSKQEWDSAISKAGLDLELATGSRKFNVCKEHYKAIKNVKKKDEKLIKHDKFGFGDQKAPRKDKIQRFME